MGCPLALYGTAILNSKKSLNQKIINIVNKKFASNIFFLSVFISPINVTLLLICNVKHHHDTPIYVQPNTENRIFLQY